MASYNLIVVTDATASMGQYLTSLRASIPEIIELSTLSGVFKRVGVIAYKDYTEPTETVAWSGWNSPTLTTFVDGLAPTGGGDWPEAAKSALIHALREIKKTESDNTLVLWYADAPPHHPSMRSYLNDQEEIKAFPKGSTDWVKLCKLAKKMNMAVFSFVPRSMEDEPAASFYVLLSQLTGGLCVSSNTASSAEISRLTLEVVLQWMGQGGEIDARLESTKVKFSHFPDSPKNAQPSLTDELEGSQGYLPPSLKQLVKPVQLRPIKCAQLHAADIPLGQNLPTMTFTKRLQDPNEKDYQEQVYKSLHSIIEKNVVALTLNNVFGQVWRAVCSQPASAEQTQLLNAFSKRVGGISDATQKKALQDWLDNSFDATAKIEEMIGKAKPGGPRICLDLDTEIGLTRTELLEVSRSCYSEVLRKVASIFTHLKLVEADVEMAAGHRYIPLSLSAQDVFRTIPHLVVPGTLYPTRAASITAVLALVTGVPFLQEKALEILTPLKGSWINLEIPENVSFECAKFLLSAPEGQVLSAEEKNTYNAMRRYKLLELNMQSNVSVKQGWTPEKTMKVGDRKVECTMCNKMRSVTMMSEEQKGVCGLCVEFKGDKTELAKYPGVGEMDSCWVECSMKTCRAQADNECLKTWYSKAEPGRLINAMELMCPFCRRLPDHHTISRYNPRAMALGNLKKALEDRRWFYAWCIECGFAQQAFERACAQGPLPPVIGFRCQNCIELSQQAVYMVQQEEEDELEGYRHNRARRRAEAETLKHSKAVRITRCPNCKTPVEKVDGCNHITCSCGTHFCHVCGAGDVLWTSTDCYDHMSKKHGGCWDFEITPDEDED